MLPDEKWIDDTALRLSRQTPYGYEDWRRVVRKVAHLAARDEVVAGLVNVAPWMTPHGMVMALDVSTDLAAAFPEA